MVYDKREKGWIYQNQIRPKFVSDNLITITDVYVRLTWATVLRYCKHRACLVCISVTPNDSVFPGTCLRFDTTFSRLPVWISILWKRLALCPLELPARTAGISLTHSGGAGQICTDRTPVNNGTVYR